MAAIESSMMPLGTTAPNFKLLDVLSDEWLELAKVKSNRATVIMFICNHCPFVVHIQQQLVALAKDYQPKGVCFLAICSNDATGYPDDAPQNMKTIGQQVGYPFPYLHDADQTIARAYDATCTPDFFVFDPALKCVYRGQLDDARPSNDIPVTGEDLRAALDALLAGKTVNACQKPSIGCSIKWAD